MANLDGILFGIGNPLLDISANVEQSLLDKYELKNANAIIADPAKHLPLYDELVKNYTVEYTAGGAAQNSMRACQWMLQHPGSVTYSGCIGKDAFGTTMKAEAEKGGMVTKYLIDNETPTGTCAVLIQKKERSMVANLGAANMYKKEHFDSDEIQTIVKKAQFYYCAGFFLTVSPETLVAIGKHAKETNKHFLMNISAPFLIDFFWDQMNSVLPYADVVFCNDDEAAHLGKKLNIGTDLEVIAKYVSEMPKENTSRKRVVIFTQGSKQTIVYDGTEIHKFIPILCPAEELVDTNGAGDSFVGGFLSQFVQGRSMADCVKAAHYCAWECIRRSGATYPDKVNFTL